MIRTKVFVAVAVMALLLAQAEMLPVWVRVGWWGLLAAGWAYVGSDALKEGRRTLRIV